MTKAENEAMAAKNKKEFVDGLISGGAYNEQDREKLNAYSAATLTEMFIVHQTKKGFGQRNQQLATIPGQLAINEEGTPAGNDGPIEPTPAYDWTAFRLEHNIHINEPPKPPPKVPMAIAPRVPQQAQNEDVEIPPMKAMDWDSFKNDQGIS